MHGHTHTYMTSFGLLNTLLQELVAAGEIAQEKFHVFKEQCTLPIAHRSLDQIKHPFEAKVIPEFELLECVTYPQESGWYILACDKDGKV